MLAAITALDVAFVGAFAGLLGVLVSPVVTLWLGRKNREQERALRMYDDRRSAYVAILREIYGRREFLRELHFRLEDETDEEVGVEELVAKHLDREGFTKMLATSMPFASRDVLTLMYAAANVFEKCMDELRTENSPERDRELVREAAARLEPAVEKLRSATYSELNKAR